MIDPEVRRTGAKGPGCTRHKVAVACWAVAAVVILALATTLVVLLSTEGSSGSDETDRVHFTQYAATMITRTDHPQPRQRRQGDRAAEGGRCGHSTGC